MTLPDLPWRAEGNHVFGIDGATHIAVVEPARIDREKLTAARDTLAGALAGTMPLRESASVALELIEIVLETVDSLVDDAETTISEVEGRT